jgi:protein-S-isoprenylcysteine O-methyltransferase Ste14
MPLSKIIHFPKAYADRVAKLRVLCGFALVVAFGVFARPTLTSLRLGLPVAVLGLGVRAWAAGHLAKNQNLARSGPYAYTRNPLYIGTLLVALGLVIASRSWWLGVLFAAVFLLVYLPVIELEEQHLRKLFPDYAGYAESVPALLPKPGPRGPEMFRPALYWRNQEYQALLGFLVGVAWLVYRAV